MAWTRYEVKQPVSPRLPNDEKSLLEALKKELWPLFNQLRGVLNWSVRWLGLVQVDDNQTPVALADAVVAGTGVTITQIGTTPAEQLEFKANATEITNIVNTTTIVNAPAAGATLHTALTWDPLLRAPCTGYSSLGAGYGLGWFEWTQISGLSTWQRSNANPLLRYVVAGNVPMVAGERFFINNSLVKERDGIYEVVTQGDGVSLSAVIRRTTDANTSVTLCHNMAVNVLDIGDGTSRYHTLSTADPIEVDTTELAWTIASTRTSTAGTFLLTPGQLASEHASSSDIYNSTSVKATDNDKLLAAPGDFVTKAGTPGISILPGGIWNFYALLHVTAANLTTPPVVYAFVYLKHIDDSVTGPFIYSSSPPITATVPTLHSWQVSADAGSMPAILPTDRIEVRFFAHTTASSYIAVNLTWSDALHTTRIVCPFQTGGQATGIHNDQTGRSEPDCHPTRAITGLEDRLFPACGWYLSQQASSSSGQLASVVEYAGDAEASAGYETTVAVADGVKALATLTSVESVPLITPGGIWKVQFKATCSSIASATYVRVTLYFGVDAIGWTYDFLLTATAATSYEHDITLPEIYSAGEPPSLIAYLSTYTASVGAVTVNVNQGGLFRIKTPSDTNGGVGGGGGPPSAHAASHAVAGSDPVSAASIGADASGAAAAVQGNLDGHTGLTTTAHGGIPSAAMLEYIAMLMG
jgi:hypothetical protein